MTSWHRATSDDYPYSLRHTRYPVQRITTVVLFQNWRKQLHFLWTSVDYFISVNRYLNPFTRAKHPQLPSILPSILGVSPEQQPSFYVGSQMGAPGAAVLAAQVRPH